MMADDADDNNFVVMATKKAKRVMGRKDLPNVMMMDEMRCEVMARLVARAGMLFI